MNLSTTNQEKLYFAELDGLRFIAFLLVFIHHTPTLGSYPILKALHDFGWIGVDLFLCLSAFLFTKLLLAEFDQKGTINIIYFYLRRTLRIWPLYFFFILGMLVIVIYEGGAIDQIRLLGLFTFTDNLMSAFWGKYNPLNSSAHLWTITYEEQFYAVIPFFLLNLFKRNVKDRNQIILMLFTAGLAIRAIFIWKEVPHPAIWVLPITHFDSILFGVILGAGMIDHLLYKLHYMVTLGIGIMFLVGVTYLPNANVVTWNLMLTYFLVGLSMALILNFTLRTSNLKGMRWITSKPVTFLGKISFGLYVYHLLTIKVIPSFFDPSPKFSANWLLEVFIMPLLATIAISSVSYIVFEKPFLRIKEKFTIISSRPV